MITFGNVFALETPVPYVSNIKEEDDRLTCVIDDECFEVPANYTNRAIDYSHQGLGFEDEDELLEFAIRQSLIEAGSENEEVKFKVLLNFDIKSNFFSHDFRSIYGKH